MTSDLSAALAVGQLAVRASGPERASESARAKGKTEPQPGEALPPAQSQRPAADEPATNRAAPTEDQVLEAVDRLREQVRTVGKDLNFEIDRESGYTVIKVIDPATEEVVRQIPAEEVVERARQHNGEIALVEELA